MKYTIKKALNKMEKNAVFPYGLLLYAGIVWFIILCVLIEKLIKCIFN